MKKLFLLTLLISPVSIFSMDEVRDLAVSGEYVPAPADEARAESDRELEVAFAAFNPGLVPQIKLDEDALLQSAREQQALTEAKIAGIKKEVHDSSADVYIQILGENFNLIVDDISPEELDRRVNTLWSREVERIKKGTLAVFKKIEAVGLVEEGIKANMPYDVEPEQIAIMVRVANKCVFESMEATSYSDLKGRVDYMRKIYAVHKAQENKASTSSTHYTTQ